MRKNQSKNVQGLKLPKNGYTTWVFKKELIHEFASRKDATLFLAIPYIAILHGS